ncbi:MAG: phage terminase large subunit family protein, partial [Phycisphaerales bacterium]|nr:phage terminase large subunit family protein [Phycisphaerales bacterium]
MRGVAVELVDAVFERYMRPPERLTVSKHAEKYRMVAGKDSPYPGPWDNARSPWLVDPMDAWNEQGVTDIVIMASTQSGKTTVMENCLYYTIDQDPRPSLYITSDAAAAKEFNDDRLIPNLEASERFARHVPVGDRRKLKRNKVTFPTMNLNLIGATSASQLARISVQRGFFDEIDKWAQVVRGRGKTEGSAEQLAEARFDAVPADEQKRVWVSTPTDEGVGIHARYTKSDQAHWEVPCPHCGKYQELRFRWERGARGGVRWEGGLGEGLEGSEFAAFVQRVRESAWYECEHCGGRIESGDKKWMNERGVYVRVGQTVRPIDTHDTRDKKPAKGEVVGDPPQTRVRGFAFNQLVVTWIPFGEVARGFVEERGVPERGWVNRVLGQAWKQPGQGTDAARMAEITVSAPGEEAYGRGTVPPEVSGMIGFIDIQSDHAWWSVRGYGAREQSWLIDYGRVECPEVVSDRTV